METQKIETQKIEIQGMNINVPAYFQQVDPMPGDPAGAVPMMVQTPYAMCLVFGRALRAVDCISYDPEEVLMNLHDYLTDDQGIIEVNGGDDYIYSIIKNLKLQGGVQYILNFQMIYGPYKVLGIQGYFEETGTTGIRDNIILEFCHKVGLVGTAEDPLSGWAKDPYDPSCIKGALMNVSEQEKYDDKFPGFPLTLCREFVKALLSEETNE